MQREGKWEGASIRSWGDEAVPGAWCGRGAAPLQDEVDMAPRATTAVWHISASYILSVLKVSMGHIVAGKSENLFRMTNYYRERCPGYWASTSPIGLGGSRLSIDVPMA